MGGALSDTPEKWLASVFVMWRWMPLMALPLTAVMEAIRRCRFSAFVAHPLYPPGVLQPARAKRLGAAPGADSLARRF
jgi:hypothetical protein